MTTKFISNNELSKLLSKATTDEKLALTKILDDSKTTPFNSGKLQKEICLCGGHGIANWFRDSGTGYLDILDDVAEVLEIHDRDSYESTVSYFDEIDVLKFSKEEASERGNKYAQELEQKIIIKVMENAYLQLEKEEENAKKDLRALENSQNRMERSLKESEKDIKSVIEKMSRKKFIFFNECSNEEIEKLKMKQKRLEKEIKHTKQALAEMPDKKNAQEKKLRDVTKRLENFNIQLSQTVNQYDSSQIGTITGTAGLMALANLGGFATYTFLTSMMSTLSLGTLGFGTYTAATSLLSVIIGPVGWAGLGLWAVFTIGKPDMNKLVLLTSTVGAIRERLLYEQTHSKIYQIPME